ncbi:class I SAM-dependent methyltransferase [Amycolatopsis magusensis]|uniref:class I SAM-dependent methyltransferase n=1 Tax=Amycolatopsis magusensis TaxID=882444 RepID=UPI0024A9D9C4|nr:class I SAM-dependent methyltransferase [Amycolatopsis magusensis]MDI5982002.1 class I SAM-dependent methyltransferase [Amycolatopsis magusensis]
MPTIGESFGVDAERYDRTRPVYPGALVADVVTRSPGREVLDVGCGTGIAARQFQAAGCTVLGVEPDERMARFARGTGIDVEVSTFEDWAPGERRFDAVIAAQAWHWVDPAAGVAKAALVLRPGGTLAVFWHAFVPPAEVNDALAAAYERAVPDPPFDLRKVKTHGYQPLADKAAGDIRAAGGFATPEHRRYEWDQRYTRDEWLALTSTTGAFTHLPPEQAAAVLDEVAAVVEDEFTVHYSTLAVTASRAAR